MSKPNVELLRRTLDYIKTHPNEWDQDRWVTKTDCGTSYCFAGWALALSGLTIHAEQFDEPAVEVGPLNKALPEEYRYSPGPWPHISVRHAAERLLGLSESYLRADDDELYSAADVLFHPDNSLDDLREYVAELCGDAVEATP